MSKVYWYKGFTITKRGNELFEVHYKLGSNPAKYPSMKSAKHCITMYVTAIKQGTILL